MADQDLKLTIAQTGAEQTAAAVEKVDVATKQVSDTTAKQAESTKKAAASTEDWANVLDRAVPGLGQFLQLGNRLVKVFKDVKPGADEAAGGAGKVGGALKILGGLGAVAAIGAITGAFQAMAQAAREAQEQIRKTSEAMTNLQAQRRDLEQSIEDIAVQRKQIGPLSAEQSTAAANLATKIGEQYPDLDRGTIARTVGTYAGTGATDDEITRAAFLLRRGEFQPKEDASAASLLSQLRGGLSSQGSFIERDMATEQQQIAQREAQVRQQAQQQGGGVIDLRALVEKFAQPGVDIDKVIEVLKEGQSTGGVLGIRNRTDKAVNEFGGWEGFSELVARFASQAGRFAGVDFGGTRSASQTEIATALAAAPSVFNDLRPAIEAHTRALQENTAEMRDLRRQPPTVTNTFTGTVHDPIAARRGRERNGQSIINSLR